MHRNQAVWENADNFIPERFLQEKETTPKIQGHSSTSTSFVPFSAGSRSCIGQRFAMMEMKIAVFYILLNFNIEPVVDNESSENNFVEYGKDYVENYDQFNMQKNKNGNAKKVEENLDAVLNKVGGIHIKLSERTCS